MPVILLRFQWYLNLLCRFFDKYSNIKCHKNPSCGSRVVPYGRTDKQDVANSRFSKFCKHAWKTTEISYDSLRVSRNPAPHSNIKKKNVTPCSLIVNYERCKAPSYSYIHSRRILKMKGKTSHQKMPVNLYCILVLILCDIHVLIFCHILVLILCDIHVRKSSSSLSGALNIPLILPFLTLSS